MYLVHWIFSPVFYLRIGKWFFEVALSGKEQPLLDKWFLAVKWKNKTFSFLQARPLARSPGLTNHRNSEFRTQKLPYTSAYTSTSIKNLWYFKCLLNVQTKKLCPRYSFGCSNNPNVPLLGQWIMFYMTMDNFRSKRWTTVLTLRKIKFWNNVFPAETKNIYLHGLSSLLMESVWLLISF